MQWTHPLMAEYRAAPVHRHSYSTADEERRQCSRSGDWTQCTLPERQVLKDWIFSFFKLQQTILCEFVPWALFSPVKITIHATILYCIK